MFSKRLESYIRMGPDSVVVGDTVIHVFLRKPGGSYANAEGVSMLPCPGCEKAGLRRCF